MGGREFERLPSDVVVMAGLVPAIHVFGRSNADVDGRDKPGRDGQGSL
jgi:hypothetical protein